MRIVETILAENLIIDSDDLQQYIEDFPYSIETETGTLLYSYETKTQAREAMIELLRIDLNLNESLKALENFIKGEK
tara:strand:+ start:42 stop:272 length:231 start_codon:yes stop_codon:yes gene_type:complete